MSDPDLDQVEPSLRAYLRARGEVDVPADLMERVLKQSTAAVASPPWRRPLSIGGGLAAAAVLVVAVAIVVLRLPAGPGPGPSVAPSVSPPSSADQTTPPPATASPGSTDSGETFPTSIAGMPVVTVAEALALIDEGRLDGRAVAVAGYWLPWLMPSCPMPLRYMAPLEGYCSYQEFASANYEAMSCTDRPDGSTECHGNTPPPGVEVLSPLLMDETSGADQLWQATSGPGLDGLGVRAVLIGHSGDPRLWHCPAETRVDCVSTFVVDRVAWLAGESIGVLLPDRRIPRRMTLEEVEAAARLGGEVLTAVALRAGDAPTIDPRLHAVGDKTIWIVRSLRAASQAGDATDLTRAVDVALIDDATGEVMASTGLEMDSSYQPARLLVQVILRGAADNDGIHPFYRVERLDGTGVQQMSVFGWSSSDSSVRWYRPGLAVVVEPGDYLVRAWRASVSPDETTGQPRDECVTQISVGPLEELTLEASYPAEGPCTWGPPTFEDTF